jgi:hypothetical protein
MLLLSFVGITFWSSGVVTPYFLGMITNLSKEYATSFFRFDITLKIYACFSSEMLVPTAETAGSHYPNDRIANTCLRGNRQFCCIENDAVHT